MARTRDGAAQPPFNPSGLLIGIVRANKYRPFLASNRGSGERDSSAKISGDPPAPELPKRSMNFALTMPFGRVQSPWMTASGDETYEIIRRRLFQALERPALGLNRSGVSESARF
jgi:hypothetical protein